MQPYRQATPDWVDALTQFAPQVVYHLVAALPGVDPEQATASVYVGVTADLRSRLRAHSRKWWFATVVPELCEFSEHATRAQAEAAERAMIRWYQPAMNRAGRLLVVTSA